MSTVTIPIHPVSPRPTCLSQLGLGMRRYRSWIIGLQWLVVLVYLALVSVPAFLPLPPDDARILNNLTLFAQFLFWGVWWPFVILSMLLMGRVWCGVFCPEGALSEFASRHGLGRPIPRWMKWGGWPFIAFLGTTVYGQLVSVYQYAPAALLILGGSTLLAIAVGFVYGKNKRVWCKHLCPVNGVFGLLSRVAPVHFSVDNTAWKTSQLQAQPIHCAPMVHIKSMRGAAECHMCGQCAGHKGAIQLAARAPGIEVLRLSGHELSLWEVNLLIFGMLGTAIGAFQWSSSSLFVYTKQWIAEWLINREWWWALDTNAPWWVLTHYPQNSDVFSWLDGAMILAYITATAVVIGGWIWIWLWLAGKTLGNNPWKNTLHLAYSLIPLAGFSIFLGLSSTTVSILRPEGIDFSWLPIARGAVLIVASFWSLTLAWGIIRIQKAAFIYKAASLLACAAAVAGVIVPWVIQFYG